MNSGINRSTWNGAYLVLLGVILGVLTWHWLGFVVIAVGVLDSIFCFLTTLFRR